MSYHRRNTLGPVTSSKLNTRRASIAISSGTGRRSSILKKENKPVRRSVGPSAIKDRKSLSIRQSMSGRQSSYIKHGGVTRREDPRNLGDASAKSQAVRAILTYLSENLYGDVLTPKTVTKPTTKSFSNMLLFLFKKLDPMFRWQKRMEEDVPVMLKGLRYPFAHVCKRSLTAVGSSMTIVPLLGILSWMVELLEYDRTLDDGSSTLGEDFDYLCNAYVAFLSGDDDEYDKLCDEYADMHARKVESLKSENIGIKSEIETLKKQLQEAENKKSELPNLELTKSECARDIGKLQTYIQQKLDTSLESLEQIIAKKRSDLEAKKQEFASVEDDRASLIDTLKNQELSAADVERMMNDRSRLKRALDKSTESRETLQKEIWDLEMELSKSSELLEANATEYNAKASQLQLIPATAQLAGGADFELRVTGLGAPSIDLKNDIKPALKELKVAIMTKTHEVKANLMEVQDAMENSEEMKNNLNEKISTLRGRFEKAEKQIQQMKSKLNQELHKMADDTEDVERQINAKIKAAAIEEEAISTSQDQLSKLEEEAGLEMISFKTKQSSLKNDLFIALNSLAEHKEMLETELNSLKEFADTFSL